MKKNNGTQECVNTSDIQNTMNEHHFTSGKVYVTSYIV